MGVGFVRGVEVLEGIASDIDSDNHIKAFTILCRELLYIKSFTIIGHKLLSDYNLGLCCCLFQENMKPQLWPVALETCILNGCNSHEAYMSALEQRAHYLESNGDRDRAASYWVLYSIVENLEMRPPTIT